MRKPKPALQTAKHVSSTDDTSSRYGPCSPNTQTEMRSKENGGHYPLAVVRVQGHHVLDRLEHFDTKFLFLLLQQTLRVLQQTTTCTGY